MMDGVVFYNDSIILGMYFEDMFLRFCVGYLCRVVCVGCNFFCLILMIGCLCVQISLYVVIIYIIINDFNFICVGFEFGVIGILIF